MQERLERETLLDRIAAIVDERGLIALTLEHLADELGLPLQQLHEYFASKQDIAVALVARDRIAQRAEFERIESDGSKTPAERSREIWEYFLSDERASRVLFESFALGIHDEHYRAFVHGVDDWLDLAEAAVLRDGVPPEDARALATLSLAVHRGAMMDYCATRARARVDAAMQLWIDATTAEEGERDA